MKNNYIRNNILLLCFFYAGNLFGQETKPPAFRVENSFAVSAGLSINIIRAAGIVDYINRTADYSQRVNDWGTAVDFFGGVEFPVSEKLGIKIDHSYLLKSYTFTKGVYGTYDLYFSMQSPTVSLQQVITGKGYFLKYGAGIGPRFGFLSQKVSFGGTHTDYRSTGFGMKAEMVGETAFDENFYGYISGQMGYDILGKVGSDSGNGDISQLSNSVSLNYFYAGLRFGVMYYF
jgi:hypothetical protein